MNDKRHWQAASQSRSWQIVPGYSQLNLTRTLRGTIIRSNYKNVKWTTLNTICNPVENLSVPYGESSHSLRSLRKRNKETIFRANYYSELVFWNNQIQTYIKFKLIASTHLVNSSCPSVLSAALVDFQLFPCRLHFFSWREMKQISREIFLWIYAWNLPVQNNWPQVKIRLGLGFKQVLVMLYAWGTRHRLKPTYMQRQSFHDLYLYEQQFRVGSNCDVIYKHRNGLFQHFKFSRQENFSTWTRTLILWSNVNFKATQARLTSTSTIR